MILTGIDKFKIDSSGSSSALTVPIFFQLTTPITSTVGALWIAMSGNPTGKTEISYNTTDTTWSDGEFWIRSVIGATASWQPYNDTFTRMKMPYPNNTLHRESGAWKAYAAYYWNGSSWVQLTNAYNYLYNSGVENVAWVQGYAVSVGAIVKNTTNMQVATGTEQGTNTAVTDTTIDLTGVNQIAFDCEFTTGSGSAYFIASTDKNGATNVYNARTSQSGTMSRTIKYVDVSALNGSYYVRCHATAISSTLTVHNVYLVY